MRLIRYFYNHFHDYHAYGPPRLKYMGWLGIFGFFTFYFLRFTRENPQPLDDIELRLTALVAMAALAARDYWPAKLRPYYIPFAYFAIMFSLPFFAVFQGLERGGGMPSISNCFIALCFTTLLTDWRNMLVMLIGSTLLAAGIYELISPDYRVPRDMVAQIPAYLVIAGGANLFKFSTEQIETERKLRATQALAGSIAHEMRHPLAGLRNSLAEIRKSLPAPSIAQAPARLEPEHIELVYQQLARGEQAVERGLQVISMTLDEVGSKPLDPNNFVYLSASDAVQKAISEYAYEREDGRTRVALHIEEDFNFRGDETAFLFVLFNLLKNALFYVPTHPALHVTIRVEPGTITVQDSGPGIEESALADLFEPFRSVGKTGGTGLGLAYCQSVMRSFGGQISVSSAPGGGTSFKLQLPQVNASSLIAQQQQQMLEAADALKGKHVLVVDDDAAVRAATVTSLSIHGIKVLEADGGQVALEMLSSHQFDAVVLDLRMPSPDGYQVAHQLRSNEAALNHLTPLLAHSSEPGHLARIKTERAGFDAFLAKPSPALTLLTTLARVITQAAARRLPLKGTTIILADDQQLSRRSVVAFLVDAGATVHEAEHGQAVLDALKQGPVPDAVILDMNMPGLDGIETTRAIRSSGRPWADVPLIALTARSDAATVEQASAAGMNDFLVKPVDRRALVQSLVLHIASGARASMASAQVAREMPPPGSAPLLNLDRLRSYRRLGMLDDLAGDYFPEVDRLLGLLREHVGKQRPEEARETLHSLLGISGEAGAQALHQHLRAVYHAVSEGGIWPTSTDWLTHADNLSASTRQALSAFLSASTAQPQEA